MDYITDPHSAELNAASKMREWGFLDAKAVTGGPDGGIDVHARGALAQVKWKGGVVGRPDVQRLYGARGKSDKQLYFFSASGYSKQAVEYGRQVGITLCVYDPTGAVEFIYRSDVPARAVRASMKSQDILWLSGALTAIVAAVGLMILTR